MVLRFMQLKEQGGTARSSRRSTTRAWPARSRAPTPCLLLAQAALAAGATLAEAAQATPLGAEIDIPAALAEGRVLAPIDHPDPAHLVLTGIGLTHLGSAEGRDKMHKAAQAGEQLTDSMRMFLMGVEGGKPAAGQVGAQPEWFYKGDGSHVVGHGAPLTSPAFAKDGGEEPEIAGVYLIGPDGTPHRLGFCLANEFSDHVIERGNYLWLAHSKLRQAALGPELLTGPLPADVRRRQDPARRPGDLGEALPVGRGEHVPHHRQSRAPPLQVRYLPQAGRRARALLRHGHPVVLGRLPDPGRRRVRDRRRAVPLPGQQSPGPSRGQARDGAPAVTPIRLALVGLGKIARDQHLPAIAADDRFELVAVVSRNADLEGVPHFATLVELLASDVRRRRGVAVHPAPAAPRPGAPGPGGRQARDAGEAAGRDAERGRGPAPQAAAARGLTLQTTWHSRYAQGVAPAREWLADKTIKSVRINWREDVRVWHPGQTWI